MLDSTDNFHNLSSAHNKTLSVYLHIFSAGYGVFESKTARRLIEVPFVPVSWPQCRHTFSRSVVWKLQRNGVSESRHMWVLRQCQYLQRDKEWTTPICALARTHYKHACYAPCTRLTIVGDEGCRRQIVRHPLTPQSVREPVYLSVTSPQIQSNPHDLGFQGPAKKRASSDLKTFTAKVFNNTPNVLDK